MYFFQFFECVRATLWDLAGHFWPVGHRLGTATVSKGCFWLDIYTACVKSGCEWYLMLYYMESVLI